MMQNDLIIDRLRRAYAMEEEMAGLLIGLMDEDVASSGLSAGDKKKALEILAAIKKDTLRHKDVLTSAMKSYGAVPV